MLLVKCCLSGYLRQLTNKGEEQLVIHKSGRGRLRERSLIRAVNYKKGRGQVTIQTGFRSAQVVARTGRLPEWSQGELPLY